MSFETARVALYTKTENLRTNWSGGYTLQVEYDNQKQVDTTDLPNPFLRVCLEFTHGAQVDLAAYPRHRVLGLVKLEAVVKEGTGRKKADELLTYFYSALQMKDAYPPLRMRAAVPMPTINKDGLAIYTVGIPFWFDDITS